MKLFNKDTKNIIGTIAMILVLLRLVDMEENASAKVLEILFVVYRVLLVIYKILLMVNSMISKFNLGDGSGDTINNNNSDDEFSNLE